MKVDFKHIGGEIKGLIKDHPQLAIILAISTPVAIFAGWYYWRRKSRIVRTAKKFIGQEEIRNNMGFIDAEFQKMISQYGDYMAGNQWCMSFAKAVWLLTFGKKYQAQLDELLTPSTITTWTNFENDKSGDFKTSDKPSRGAIVIWQQHVNGAPQWKGHAGIVQKWNNEEFQTIEGNTAAIQGIDRVAEKIHTYKWDVNNGLRLKGFISVN
jgi:hypothetical protein